MSIFLDFFGVNIPRISLSNTPELEMSEVENSSYMGVQRGFIHPNP